jgi:GH25 family lysozyme M1 (1,4-beta-N-acetylmuramidase)
MMVRRSSKRFVFFVLLCACSPGRSEHDSPGDAAAPCIRQHAQAISICADHTELLRGIDVSTYQGTIDWAEVAGHGIAFAFVRVSDGVAHPDDQFVANWQGTRAHGIVRGVYQFFRPLADPIEQAELMLAKLEAAGGLEATDLPPVLDLEDDDGVSVALYQERALAWIAHVEARTGRRPIVYSAAFFSPFTGTAFSAYPLWVANYKPTYVDACPTMPDGWQDWVLWQWTDRDHVRGVTGNVDGDVFDGDRHDLDAFIAASHLRTPDAGYTSDAGPTDPPYDGGAQPSSPSMDAGTEGDGPGSTMGAGQECAAELIVEPMRPDPTVSCTTCTTSEPHIARKGSQTIQLRRAIATLF